MKDMAEETGPRPYRVGYTEDGDKVEYWNLGDQASDYPLIIRRGDKAIVKAMDEMGAELDKTRDELERGLYVGRLSALNWVLGGQWDRSVVDVTATSSSRDDDAIRE